MAQLGQYNTLKVAKIVDFGLYLDGGEGVEILMPKRYMPQDVKVGDELKVFVYQDAEARLIATNEHPYATVGQFAYLKINSVNAVGAFADWGTSKELLIPHREQAQKMEEGPHRRHWQDRQAFGQRATRLRGRSGSRSSRLEANEPRLQGHHQPTTCRPALS